MTHQPIAKGVTEKEFFVVYWWNNGSITAEGFEPKINKTDDLIFASFNIDVPQDLEIPNRFNDAGWRDYLILSDVVPEIVECKSVAAEDCLSYLDMKNVIIRVGGTSILGGRVVTIGQKNAQSYVMEYQIRNPTWLEPVQLKQTYMHKSDRLQVEIYSMPIGTSSGTGAVDI